MTITVQFNGHAYLVHEADVVAFCAWLVHQQEGQ